MSNSKKVSNLDDFRNMIDTYDDKEVLDVGYQLLSEVMEINSLKSRLKTLEDNLTEGKKAMFYFFVAGLSEDEVVYAAERIKGRINRLSKK
jgi:hypothetical protein